MGLDISECRFMNLIIIVPCYNESKRLEPSAFEGFMKIHPELSYLFVNDGSKDQTLSILKKMENHFPNQVKILNLEKNLGKANAVRVGMRAALDEKKYDRMAFLDADLSTPLEDCYGLSKKIDAKTQFVFASRLKKLDNHIQRKWYRFFIGRIIATLISKMLRLPVYDTQCGCKIFSSKIVLTAFEKPFISRWLFDVEIFFRLKKFFGAQLLKISKEVPLNTWIDLGDSRIEPIYGLLVWKDLLKIYRHYK